ncbi:tetraspanin-9-like protein [Leptotrombidium deliense]|uniref:Tetraspanin n=1 Tax=Leptotrombidium deliense TaxID=299467 RepID=A0A443S025_9ACAR|nr:tetraspanin-9-like protein [Leptotrombidium deliense]
MGCGVTCLKLIVVLFNIFVAIAGGLLLGCGVFFKIKVSEEINFEKAHDVDAVKKTIDYIAIGVVALGALLLVTAIVGIFGAIFRNICALIIYSIILSLITIFIGAIGFFSLLSESTAFSVPKNLKKDINKNAWTSAADTTKGIGLLQKDGKCCGIVNYKDWDEHRPPGNPVDSYPLSCCTSTVTSNTCTKNSAGFNEKGCLKFAKDILNYAKYFGVGCFIISVILLLISIFSCILICSKKNDNERDNGMVLVKSPRTPEGYPFEEE